MSTAMFDNNINSSHTNPLSHGNNISQRQFKKQWNKLAKQKARLVFLLKCRRHNLTPRFIIDKVTHLTKKNENSANNVKRKVDGMSKNLKQSLLNIELSLCHVEISNLEKKIKELEAIIHVDDLDQTLHCTQQSYEHQLQQSNAKVYKKFTNLVEKQEHLADIKFEDSFIKNLTDLEIPKEMLTLLSLGPKFSTMPGKDPIIDLVSDVELAIKREVPIENQRTARGEASYSITKFSRQNRKLNRIDRYLQKAIKITKEFLEKHKNVMVSNSDKGNVTKISEKSYYHAKIEQLMSDVNAFTPLNADPTTKIKNRVNTCLNNLAKANLMAQKLKTSLKSFNAVPPRLFGQIKYHKAGNPVRLIVSTINSAAYKMARFLATILRKSFKSKYDVKEQKYDLT